MVKIDEHCSETRNVSCGVPQGSILGPLLFLCYVNDMKISVSCKLLLYADDSILIVPHKDVNFIKNRLGKELESCNTWMINNKLSLHLGKTEIMLVGSKTKLKNVDNFNITCLGQEINGVKSVKTISVENSFHSIVWFRDLDALPLTPHTTRGVLHPLSPPYLRCYLAQNPRVLK